MPVLPDHWIKRMASSSAMIVPVAAQRPRKGKISYGASSYGYDFRLSEEYKIPEIKSHGVLDPKKMDETRFRDHKGAFCLVPASSFVLGRSLEYFRIPRGVLVVCQGKSTYARSGLIVNVTPLEPEWEGFITIALVNPTQAPIKVYSGEGIAQAIFIRAESECTTSYKDRKGKYQAQKQIRLATVDRK
jgi:dCTP deaminase